MPIIGQLQSDTRLINNGWMGFVGLSPRALFLLVAILSILRKHLTHT